MGLNAFDLIAELERDIVDFYKKVLNVNRFSELKDIFENMEFVSDNHEKSVNEMASRLKQPSFNRQLVFKMQEQIKTNLWNEIMSENDKNVVLEKVAKGEESIGKLYEAISSYYLNVSNYYKEISDHISNMAQEEYQHRDAILKQKIEE